MPTSVIRSKIFADSTGVSHAYNGFRRLCQVFDGGLIPHANLDVGSHSQWIRIATARGARLLLRALNQTDNTANTAAIGTVSLRVEAAITLAADLNPIGSYIALPNNNLSFTPGATTVISDKTVTMQGLTVDEKTHAVTIGTLDSSNRVIEIPERYEFFRVVVATAPVTGEHLEHLAVDALWHEGVVS